MSTTEPGRMEPIPSKGVSEVWEVSEVRFRNFMKPLRRLGRGEDMRYEKYGKQDGVRDLTGRYPRDRAVELRSGRLRGCRVCWRRGQWWIVGR